MSSKKKPYPQLPIVPELHALVKQQAEKEDRTMMSVTKRWLEKGARQEGIRLK